ncbi:MAG: hypothetical protein QM677_00615 [Microbacterium sp.]
MEIDEVGSAGIVRYHVAGEKRTHAFWADLSFFESVLIDPLLIDLPGHGDSV